MSKPVADLIAAPQLAREVETLRQQLAEAQSSDATTLRVFAERLGIADADSFSIVSAMERLKRERDEADKAEPNGLCRLGDAQRQPGAIEPGGSRGGRGHVSALLQSPLSADVRRG